MNMCPLLLLVTTDFKEVYHHLRAVAKVSLRAVPLLSFLQTGKELFLLPNPKLVCKMLHAFPPFSRVYVNLGNRPGRGNVTLDFFVSKRFGVSSSGMSYCIDFQLSMTYC